MARWPQQQAPHAAGQTSVATPLAWAYAALVLYASLFPFTGWRWPPGHGVAELLALPWPPWLDPFDLWANLIGYLPWGWLLAVSLRSRWGSAWRALLGTVAIAAAVSFGVEVTQNFLPGRHPSLKDCAMNTLGAGMGAAVALLTSQRGAALRWLQLRQRLFVPRSGGALALLALWPVALLFPAPVPLGLGQAGDKLRDFLEWLVEDVPWAQPLQDLLQASNPSPDALSPLTEGLATALGLFAPCMLAYAVARNGPHRLLLSVGAAAVAALTMALSALLNYGPQHAWAWLTPTTLPAMAGAVLAAVGLMAVPRRVACGLALMALAGCLALVAQAPTDPYFALNLQSWEQGRWVRFHGVAQWVGLAWPYLAMVWLLLRLGQADERV